MRQSPNTAGPSDLNPITPWHITTSVIALKARGELDEAIAEYRQAIRLIPDYA